MQMIDCGILQDGGTYDEFTPNETSTTRSAVRALEMEGNEKC